MGTVFNHAVTVPTYAPGHTLDIVMFRPNDDIVCSTTVTQLLSSDHYCVVCVLSAIKFVNHATQTVKKFTWHIFDNL